MACGAGAAAAAAASASAAASAAWQRAGAGTAMAVRTQTGGTNAARIDSAGRRKLQAVLKDRGAEVPAQQL